MAEDIFTRQGTAVKESINQAKKLINFFWKKKWWILLSSLLLGVLLSVKAYTTPGEYEATITFMVKEEGGGSFGGLTSLLGMIGGGATSSKYNLDKVVAIAKSQNIIQMTILDSVEIDGKKDLLGNFIVSEFNLLEQWRESEGPISEFKKFSKNDTGIVANTAIKKMYNLVAGPNNKTRWMSVSFDKDNTILSLKVTTESDKISIKLANEIYSQLAKYYIQQSIEKAQITVTNLERKADMVERKLNSKVQGLATVKDKTLGLYMAQDETPQVRLSRDVQINSILYGELIKNLETARFSLQNATPIFQIIDEPFLPLRINKPSIIIYALMGTFIGGLISIAFLYIKFLQSSS